MHIDTDSPGVAMTAPLALGQSNAGTARARESGRRRLLSSQRSDIPLSRGHLGPLQGLPPRIEPPRDVGRLWAIEVGKTLYQLSALPSEVAIAILDAAEPTPMQLFTLISGDTGDTFTPSLIAAARNNSFWLPYSPGPVATEEGEYAKAFRKRWHALSKSQKTLLQHL